MTVIDGWIKCLRSEHATAPVSINSVKIKTSGTLTEKRLSHSTAMKKKSKWILSFYIQHQIDWNNEIKVLRCDYCLMHYKTLNTDWIVHMPGYYSILIYQVILQ